MADRTKSKSQWEMIKETSTPDQMFCWALSILLLGYFPTIFQNCVTYTHLRKLERPDYPQQSIEDFLYLPIYVLIVRLAKVVINYLSLDYFTKKLSPKYRGHELEMKAMKCTKGAFKVVHFGFTFFFGWLMVLSDTKFCPPLMLGNGEMLYIMSDWPFTEMPQHMKFYYMFSLSYYVEDLIMHLVNTPRNDYAEMVLHHLITMLLIFASYFNSFWNFGIFVLMQMDIADVFVGMIRVIMDFSSVIAAFTVYLGILFSFVYFRVICFTYIILYSFCFRERVVIDGTSDMVTIITILLVFLLFMNIYWIILLLKMAYKLLTTGKKVDLQCVVSKKDVEN